MTTPADQDQVAALAYWSQEIRPTLGDLPMEGLRFLRNQYLTDVRLNPEALRQVREWWNRR